MHEQTALIPSLKENLEARGVGPEQGRKIHNAVGSIREQRQTPFDHALQEGYDRPAWEWRPPLREAPEPGYSNMPEQTRALGANETEFSYKS